jgi:tripartite-type tricarboxylate transporter receptor subunit TctC
MFDRRKMNCLAGAALVSMLPGARAQPSPKAWPDRPIRLLLGQSPGGTPDVVNRQLAERLGAELGQTMFVENRPSAGGVVALQALKASAPDGYTLAGVFWAQLSVMPSLMPNLPYDTVRDFTPIGTWLSGPQVLVAGPSAPGITTMAELLIEARRKPGAMQYASPGVASPGHIFMEQLNASAAVDLRHVPFSGSGAVLGNLRGDVPVLMAGVGDVLPHVKDGKLRALAVCADRRLAALPGVPTMAECGIVGLDRPVWHGLIAPSGTPTAVVERIHAALVSVAAQPAFVQSHEALGRVVSVSTPERMREIVRSEIPVWADLVRRAGITLQ